MSLVDLMAHREIVEKTLDAIIRFARAERTARPTKDGSINEDVDIQTLDEASLFYKAFPALETIVMDSMVGTQQRLIRTAPRRTGYLLKLAKRNEKLAQIYLQRMFAYELEGRTIDFGVLAGQLGKEIGLKKQASCNAIDAGLTGLGRGRHANHSTRKNERAMWDSCSQQERLHASSDPRYHYGPLETILRHPPTGTSP